MRRIAVTVALLVLAITAISGCTPGSPGNSPEPGPAGQSTGRWVPSQEATWQYQLSGRIDTSVAASVYDIDGFDTPSSTVATLHSLGRKVVCYVNAGAWEDWRADRDTFPPSLRGRALDGWPGEQWLDVRQVAALEPLLAARFDRCQAKGFDAIEADNVDGYANDTGFPITGAHQLAYNRILARLAHERGLSIGLKNDVEQAAALVSSFDFAVNEECFEWSECEALKPFVDAGKAVFHVEYEASPGEFCAATTELGFSSIRKKLSLDAWRHAC